MKKIRAHFGDRSYSISIGKGILKIIGEEAGRFFPGGRALVVTDRNVSPLQGPGVLKALARAGCEASLFAVPAGPCNDMISSPRRPVNATT